MDIESLYLILEYYVKNRVKIKYFLIAVICFLLKNDCCLHCLWEGGDFEVTVMRVCDFFKKHIASFLN